MARIARIVVPGYPHHITQRGNRRQETFFCDDDYRQYIDLMAEWCSRCNVHIWAYCLMPNHIGARDLSTSSGGLSQLDAPLPARFGGTLGVRRHSAQRFLEWLGPDATIKGLSKLRSDKIRISSLD